MLTYIEYENVQYYKKAPVFANLQFHYVKPVSILNTEPVNEIATV